jgi:MoaA/NifB/PqqE/SkfB family radical SAM enzyme
VSVYGTPFGESHDIIDAGSFASAASPHGPLDPLPPRDPNNLQRGSGTAIGASAFYAEAHRRKTPLNVQLQLTDRCNLKCEFCYNSLEHKPDELSFAEITNILEQLRAAGTLFLCLTGGEPTLHPRFADIARLAHSMGFALEVITNATLLNETHFALFREIMPRYIAVSLHGLQQASHERLTRSPGSFNRTVASIMRMKELAIPVQLRIPITRYNFNELDELITYAEAIGIPHRLDCNITYREDGDPTSTAPRMDRAKQATYYERQWTDYLRKNPNVGVIGHNPEPVDKGHLCAAGHTYCYIDSLGTVHPCPSYQRPIGSIRDKPFAQIWNAETGTEGDDFLHGLRGMTHGKLDGCDGCGDKAFCHFCPGDSRMEGKDKTNGWAKYQRACTNAAVNREAYERIVFAGEPAEPAPAPTPPDRPAHDGVQHPDRHQVRPA